MQIGKENILLKVEVKYFEVQKIDNWRSIWLKSDFGVITGEIQVMQ